MKTALYKDNVREITRSLGRFLSIFMIVAIGTAIFAGVKASAPNMKNTADRYYDDYNMMDLRVLSTLGLTDDDMQAMKTVKGVERVQPSYFADVVTTIDSIEFVFRAHALPVEELQTGSEDYLNRTKLTTGRYPQVSGECVIEDSTAIDLGLNVGDTFTVSSGKKEDLTGVLKKTTFTIVGKAVSPYYLTYDKDSSDIGSGKVDFFMMILSTDFDYPVFTEALVTVTGAKALSSYSNDYQRLIERVQGQLENLVAERAEVRLVELKAEANRQLDEARQESSKRLSEAKIEAERQLSEAKAKAMEKLADASVRLKASEERYNAEIASAQEELNKAQDKLVSAQAELATEKKNYELRVADAQRQIDEGEVSYQEGLADYNAALASYQEAEEAYGQSVQDLNDVTGELNQINEIVDDQLADYTAGTSTASAAQSTAASVQAAVTAGEIGLFSLSEEPTSEEPTTEEPTTAEPTTTEAPTTTAEPTTTETSATTASETSDTSPSTGETSSTETSSTETSSTSETSTTGTSESSGTTDDPDPSTAEPTTTPNESTTGDTQTETTGTSTTASPTTVYALTSEQVAQLQEIQAQAKTALGRLNNLNETAQLSMENAQDQLDSAKNRLDQARDNLNQAKIDLATAKSTTYSDFAKADRDMMAGYSEYDIAYATFLSRKNAGKLELEAARQQIKEETQRVNDQLNAETLKANDQLASETLKANEQLVRAEDKIERLSQPSIYVLDRSKVYSYADYAMTADRMDALSKLFPIFLFAVAALVSLTTMSRMVDEQRGKIGTLKALGYSNGEIAGKYLGYAILPSLLGGAAGVMIGVRVFPRIIFDSWSMMYTLPPMQEVQQVLLMALTVLAGVFVTTYAAYSACVNELKTVPAQLMRPKAPPPGKLILLERVDWFWGKMSFSQKVTLRNIFRYKKRFFMTEIGIAGCAALLIAGFGLSDSIRQLVDRQYTQIFTYNLGARMEPTAEFGEINQIATFLSAKPEVASLTQVTSMNVRMKNEGDEIAVTLLTPENNDEFAQYVSLRNRSSRSPIALPPSGIVLTEKLAKELGVGLGDPVSIDNGVEAVKKLEVAGITENYIFHYAYISREAYSQVFRITPVNNYLMVRLNQTSLALEKSLASELISLDNIASASYFSDVARKFYDMVASLNAIVLALIISAGILAFVVLYNLTNINIGERIREIATIKVLGFYNNEVSQYVFRENIFLTVLGSALGLVLGIFLHRVIMTSIEQDGVMFGNFIAARSFLFAFALSCAFSLLVNLFMKRRLERIPMVESLKSIE